MVSDMKEMVKDNHVPAVSLTLAVVSILVAFWSVGGYIDDQIDGVVADHRPPVTILDISASASGVYLTRRVDADADGTFHAVYYRVGGYGGPVCEGSGAAPYEVSEPQRQYFPHNVWANDPDCVNLPPGDYVIETEWAWHDQASSQTTSAKYVTKFVIEKDSSDG